MMPKASSIVNPGYSRSTTTPEGYSLQPDGRAGMYNGIYVGFVKDNRDVIRMGRLRVWIPEFDSHPSDETKWITVNYVSPFAGATNPDKNKKGGSKYTESQQSYGFYAVPPDLENEVLIAFINGDSSRGVWIGCLYQQFMNHMVPGIPSNKTTDGQEPAGEYNKWNRVGQQEDPERPVFEPLADALATQGLDKDAERGWSTSGARRATDAQVDYYPKYTDNRDTGPSPAKVYGLKSPLGHQFVMDDSMTNPLYRLRTSNGTQIMMHDDSGYVYIITRNGNSWVEIGDNAINIYSSKDINMRTHSNMNIHVGKDFNLHVEGNMNLFTGKNKSESIKQKSNLLVGQESYADYGSDFNQTVLGSLKQTVKGGTLNLKSKGNIVLDTEAKIGLTSIDDIAIKGRFVYENTSQLNALNAVEANTKLPKDQPDRKLQSGYPSDTKETIVTSLVTHEPYKRTGSTNTTDIDNLVDRQMAAKGTTPTMDTRKKAMERNMGGGGENAKQDPSRNGVKPSGAKTAAKIKSYNPSEKTLNAIDSAIEKTGMDDHRGYMLAMAAQESSFNPDAKAGTSSAKGLYQITNGTAKNLADKYGAEYGFTAEDVYDPEKNATMAALYAKENERALTNSLGRDVTNTDLYMGHFLGTKGATTFLSADPNATAASINPSAAASNPNVFYVNGNPSQPRTVGEVYSYFENKIEPNSIAFNQQYPKATPTS